MLRFGDGTPFPLDEGFLQVLVEAVGACTSMLTATANMEERHALARVKQRELLDEEHQLERFEQTVRMAAATANEPANRPTPKSAEQATRRTIAAMQHAMKHAREQLKRSALDNAAKLEWLEAARHVERVVGGFFERHVLPGTVWSWSWDATPGRSSFEATARGARFSVDFDLQQDVLWRAPIRIAALASGIVMELPRRRWFGKPAVVPVPLDRCVLVEARCDPAGRSLVIQERAGAAPGWRISLPRDEAASATAFDRRGRTIAVSPVTTEQLDALVDALDLQLHTRLAARRARTVLLGDVSVSTIGDTTLAPRALLDELGPIVREIRSRSRVPGELSIKRDVAAGVREELFVSRTQLAACYASLPSQYRHLFDAIGVGRSLTEVLDESSSAATLPPAPSPSALPPPAPPPALSPPAPPPVLSPPAPPPAQPPIQHRPQRVNAHPPPIPRRSSARTPTTPVRSLRSIPTQSSVVTTFWVPRRPATPTA